MQENERPLLPQWANPSGFGDRLDASQGFFPRTGVAEQGPLSLCRIAVDRIVKDAKVQPRIACDDKPIIDSQMGYSVP